jgi:hypothetical protein
MGESAQINFTPIIFGRNFADLGEFPPNQQTFGWDIGRISPISKKIRPKILGRNLTAWIRPFSGDKELLCVCLISNRTDPNKLTLLFKFPFSTNSYASSMFQHELFDFKFMF